MPYTVVIKQEAHLDTVEAYNYYTQKQTGLGDRFLDALQIKYKALSANPTYFSLIDEDPLKVLRDVKLDKFPFVIVYEIIENTVVVYAVHNTYKHPTNKLRKA